MYDVWLLTPARWCRGTRMTGLLPERERERKLEGRCVCQECEGDEGQTTNVWEREREESRMLCQEWKRDGRVSYEQ